jgi:hypothetical protein
MTNRTCRQAQTLLQRLLDRHHTGPLPPKLHRHVQACPTCRTWQCLFQYDASGAAGLPAQFADRVVTRFRREERLKSWLYRGTMFAAAATIAAAFFLGAFLLKDSPPGPSPLAAQTPEKSTRPDLSHLITQWRTDLERLPNNITLVTPTPPEWTVPTINLPAPEPYEAGVASLRTLTGSLQGAVEPLQYPAREAYQKVINFVDAPEVQKWFQKVKQGMG